MGMQRDRRFFWIADSDAPACQCPECLQADYQPGYDSDRMLTWVKLRYALVGSASCLILLTLVPMGIAAESSFEWHEQRLRVRTETLELVWSEGAIVAITDRRTAEVFSAAQPADFLGEIPCGSATVGDWSRFVGGSKERGTGGNRGNGECSHPHSLPSVASCSRTMLHKVPTTGSRCRPRPG
jgi:hypothetical protein